MRLGRRGRARLGVAGVGVAFAAACAPIAGTPASQAPRNACDRAPCEAYRQPGAKPICTNEGRCEVAGRPPYPYVLAVAIPGSSFFAPNRTLLLRSQELRGEGASCPSVSCIALPPLVEVSGAFQVSSDVADQVGYGLGPGPHVLPARAVFYREILLDDGARVEATDVGLPAQPLFAEQLPPDPEAVPTLSFRAFAPPGLYRRAALPESPYDAAFPPLNTALSVRVEGTDRRVPYFRDAFVLGTTPNGLDDPSGESRTAQVKRAAGLEGFVTYLRDRKTERRVSPVRPLAGAQASVRLDTVAENGAAGSLRDGIDIVVAPSSGWVAVPTLVDRILAGAGLRLDYPALPPPAAVSGRVVGEAGVVAQIAFVSTAITTLDGAPSSSLGYSAAVRTDASGRFATVLPPGTYDAFVTPQGLAQSRQSVTVQGAGVEVTLRVRRKGVVSGMVRLSDGRVVAIAEVEWAPSQARRAPAWAAPRAARTVTDDLGAFAVALDEGEYDLSVQPEAQSGFPRVVSLGRPVGPDDATIEELTIVAPTRVAWTVKDPSGLAPIVRAVVRAFAYVPTAGQYVEVGAALTDSAGQFEMLLGPLPR